MKTLLIIEILLSLALVSLSGCGRGVGGPSNIDPAFKAYADAFNEAAAAHGSQARAEVISIEFADLSGSFDGGERGVCHKGGARSIEIDRLAWAAASDADREELIFHELGHCVLDRQHEGSMVFADGSFVPASIMHATLAAGTVYEGRRSEYLSELFD